jgi:cytochrome c peroxidase
MQEVRLQTTRWIATSTLALCGACHVSQQTTYMSPFTTFTSEKIQAIRQHKDVFLREVRCAPPHLHLP